jgi:hypothetical protein
LGHSNAILQGRDAIHEDKAFANQIFSGIVRIRYVKEHLMEKHQKFKKPGNLQTISTDNFRVNLVSAGEISTLEDFFLMTHDYLEQHVQLVGSLPDSERGEDCHRTKVPPKVLRSL